MKRVYTSTFVIFITILIFLMVSVNKVRSQEGDTNLTTNYTLQLEEYQRAHNQYVLARSNYQRFNTLAAEEQAFDATMEMLIARNDVVISYIDLIIDSLENIEGLDQQKKDELSLLLQVERDWFEQHTGITSSAATLGELVEDSNEARSRFSNLNNIIYLSFSYLSYAKVNDYNTRLVGVYSDLREKFETIRNEERDDYKFSDEKVLTIDNWLTESQASITRSEDVLDNVRSTIDLSNKNDANSYNEVVGELQNSRLHMQKATSYMKEVIREIKTE